LSGSGVSTDVLTSYAARIMAISIPVIVWQSCLDLLLQLYLCLLTAYIRYCADLRKLWTLHLGNFFNSTFSYRIRV